MKLASLAQVDLWGDLLGILWGSLWSSRDSGRKRLDLPPVVSLVVENVRILLFGFFDFVAGLIHANPPRLKEARDMEAEVPLFHYYYQ